MNVLITYFSMTGNTKKIAGSMYDGISATKTILPLKEVDSVDDYDIVFVGFPVHEFGAPKAVKAFFENTAMGSNIALFVTHAMIKGAPVFESQMERCREVIGGNNLLGAYSCRGELAESVAERMAASDDKNLQMFGRMRPQTVGHPDSSEIAEAVEFANGIIAGYQ